MTGTTGTKARAANRTSTATQRRLYEPLSWALVRAPMLPVEAYPYANMNGEPPLRVLRDHRLQAALAVASPDLHAALARGVNGRARRVAGKLLRYAIRMSTRPTPYGLFAGVALAQWGATTDLALSSAQPRTRTRPDMEWLRALISALEGDADVRHELSLVANPLLLIRGGRLFVGEGGRSLRATGAVVAALREARRPIPYRQLAAVLAARPGATPERAGRLITELWSEGALLTDLRPSLTGGGPLDYVRSRLSTVPAARPTLDGLDRVQAELGRWDEMPLSQRGAAYRTLVDTVRSVHPIPTGASAVQVDTALPLAASTLHTAVGQDAALAGELLARLSSYPRGLPHLEAYRNAFEYRYGPDREVPLLELLDPQFGLGPPNDHRGGWDGVDPERSARRGATLRELALAACRDKALEVELDDELLTALETSVPTAATALPSLDISVFVVARSAAAIDAGDFRVVIGPNLGASEAGRNLGRFCDLLGRDGVRAAATAAQAGDVRSSDAILAEIVYMPKRARSANVATRPAMRDYEIHLGAAPGVPWDRVIPVNELVVGVRGGRFYVYWPAGDALVVATQGHMLNARQAPHAVRFLLDVASAGRVQLSAFDWGPASGFPFLPRVRYGRIVLAPAQWRIGPAELATEPDGAFASTLDAWRERWSVPKEVYLATGDNRLLLDLDDPEHTALLQEELRTRRGQSALLQEALPSRQDAWLEGPDGRHIVELVVPIVLSVASAAADPGQPETRSRPSRRPGPSGRLRSPGSDWLYLKLYCPPAFEEDVIADSLLSFGEFATHAGLVDAWFFLRYTDPDPHLRIRFHGTPGTLTGGLFAQVCDWAGELMSDDLCLRFGFDTYERELERYGGEEGMRAAEAIFAADSPAVAEMIRLSREGGVGSDRLTLAILSIDDMLASLGLPEAERTAWYRDSVQLSRRDGQDYRDRQRELRHLLGETHALLREPGGEPLARVLADRAAALTDIGNQLRALDASGRLRHSVAQLCGSYVHLHSNRLVGIGSPIEQRALQLLRRVREGLARAPVERPAGTPPRT